jgi:ribonuclease HII
MQQIESLIRQPVSKLRAVYFEQGAPTPKGLLEALEADPRRAARDLAAKLRARAEGNRAEGQRLRRLQRFENELREQGFTMIAGVDEAGVGPLAGPVVAGAVILPAQYKLRELDDSKKLDAATRDALALRIKADALSWAIGVADVAEIDQLNIYHAGLLAMRRAVEALNDAPDYLLVDARTIPDCPCDQRGLIRGDSLSASIAAASILAKTTRDEMMAELDLRYPVYGFASHKGYPTPEHFRSLREHGASPAHRRSFRPVREALGLEPVQSLLFG